MTLKHGITLANVFLQLQSEVYRAVRRRVNSSHAADDIVHDVYVRCHNHHGGFATHDEARAYMLRIAANLSIDYLRVERRRADILGELLPVIESNDVVTDDPQATALANDIARQVEAVLAKLPTLTRQMFVLVRLRGMTHQEVARELGVSKSLVDKYMVQALIACRDALGGLGGLD